MDEKNKQDPTVQEEAGLGPEWKVVDEPAIRPSQPSVPFSLPNGMAPYFGGSISSTLQHDYVFSQTKYGTPAIPSLPLMPLSASGQPTVGSAVQSGSTTTIQTNVNAVAAGPNGAIQFNNGGALGGSAAFLFNSGTISLTVNATVNITGSVTITGSLILTGTVGANIFNATTGFQIGGAAASGKYLRGNGTNFVSATLSGSDILTGLVGIAFGGTGTATPALVPGQDITITGSWPDNTIAVSTQAGVTPGSYTSANLTVDSSGIITAVSNGSAGPVITSANRTVQTANVAATNLVASASAGTYLITVYLVVSQAASISSALPDSRIIFTDNESGATITTSVTSGLTTNTTSTFAQATFIVNAKSTTAIQFDIGQVTPYASSGGTPMQFAYHARAVFLG